MTGIADGQDVAETLTEHWFDLIDKMLILDPKKRLTAEQALKHPFFTDSSVPPACPPSELPVNQMDDHHEYITKAERNKKKDFRKQFTFRHNLDQTNYNNEHPSGSNSDKYHGNYQSSLSRAADQHSFWKAT